MGFLKMNDFGLGPEGTSHKSPARSAGIESKWRLRPEGTVHKVPGIHVRFVLFAIPTVVPMMRRPFRTRVHLPRPAPAPRAGLL